METASGFFEKYKKQLEYVFVILRNNYLSYTEAWDLSISICSLFHPGDPPCFLPLDFCESVPTRSAKEMALALKDSCPAVEVYNMYHSLRINKFYEASARNCGRSVRDSWEEASFNDLEPYEVAIKGVRDANLELEASDTPLLDDKRAQRFSGCNSVTSSNNQKIFEGFKPSISTHYAGVPSLTTISSVNGFHSSTSSDSINTRIFFDDKGQCYWEIKLVDRFVWYLRDSIELLDVQI